MRIHSNFYISGDSDKKNKGSAFVEAIIAIPIIIFAALLTLQITLLFRAKIALNYATQEAARVGSMSNARIVPRYLTDWSSFLIIPKKNQSNKPTAQPANLSQSVVSSSDGRQPNDDSLSSAAGSSQNNAPEPPPTPERPANPKKNYFINFGKSLLRYGDSSVLQGFITGMTPYYTKGPDFLDVAKGQISAYGDAMMNSCILYHSPTQTAFFDFGFVEIEGPDKWILQIPNDFMRYRIPGSVDRAGKGVGYYKKHGKYLSDETESIKGPGSSMSIQDATLLSIEVKYSVKMVVPIAREILTGLAILYSEFDNYDTELGRVFAKDALKKNRWPLSATATYRMQSPVHWNLLMPFDLAFTDPLNIARFKVHEKIAELWNSIPSDALTESLSGKPQIGFCPGLVADVLDGGSLPGQTLETSPSWLGEDYDRKIFNERNP